jgi:hypothetical protein
MLPVLLLWACGGSDPVDTTDDSDPADTEVPDTDPIDTAEENDPPSAPAVALVPAVPAAGFDLTATVTAPSVDPEGREITYAYAWTADGAPVAEVTGEVVPGSLVVDGQVWAVTVTPNDGLQDGPAGTASGTVGNSPPSAPTVSIQPYPPTEKEPIELVFDVPSVDPDGDPLITKITWYENGTYVTWYQDLTVIEGRYVTIYDTFRAVVEITDGYHEPVVVEASTTVEYGCENLPPFNLDDATITTASAYHGISFDDDGNLIGQDTASASIIKSKYDGTQSVWVPGMPGIQQIDRLPDGDFVAADSTMGRVVRISAATGGTETIAGGLGGLYGVTTGPDGMVYVTNGGVVRVDPDTGDTEVIASGSFTAHDVDFNLDSTVMYIGTIGAGLLTLDLDMNLDPVGTPSVWVTGATYIDGVALDACGNVYVADYSSSQLYRYEADGTSTSMVSGARTLYGHGITWGNGIGGWEADTIYQPMPYNGDTVREVKIGLASGDTVRTWNGVAVPW